MNSVTSRPAAAFSPTPDMGSLSNALKAKDAKASAQASRNFEATLLSMLLKEMRSSLEPGGMFAGDKSDIQGGLFDFFMGQSLAQSGGIGIARFLQNQLQTKAAP